MQWRFDAHDKQAAGSGSCPPHKAAPQRDSEADDAAVFKPWIDSTVDACEHFMRQNRPVLEDIPDVIQAVIKRMHQSRPPGQPDPWPILVAAARSSSRRERKAAKAPAAAGGPGSRVAPDGRRNQAIPDAGAAPPIIRAVQTR